VVVGWRNLIPIVKVGVGIGGRRRSSRDWEVEAVSNRGKQSLL
jgi:hypothetical protein